MTPEVLDQLFPAENQRNYVSMLMGRGGVTRSRAEYFVRLWAYLFLKEQREVGRQLGEPLTQLQPPQGLVPCTHREAAELFYGSKERGSDRAAGMMIDRLAALGLLEKRFDGQTLCLKIHSIPELLVPPSQQNQVIQLEASLFNPRTDAVPVANLVTRTYAELIRDSATASLKISRALRSWAQQYPLGMRVLRRSDNGNPVGISVIYPVVSASEVHFFQPPSKSFYLTSDTEVDPFKIAAANDLDCTSVYIRAWIIDAPYLQKANLCLMLEDTQQTLAQLQQDFPNLCDVYSLIVHPLYEELRQAIGFQKLCSDTQRHYHWIHLALDRFLELDIQKAIAGLRLGATSGQSKPE